MVKTAKQVHYSIGYVWTNEEGEAERPALIDHIDSFDEAAAIAAALDRASTFPAVTVFETVTKEVPFR